MASDTPQDIVSSLFERHHYTVSDTTGLDGDAIFGASLFDDTCADCGARHRRARYGHGDGVGVLTSGAFGDLSP